MTRAPKGAPRRKPLPRYKRASSPDKAPKAVQRTLGAFWRPDAPAVRPPLPALPAHLALGERDGKMGVFCRDGALAPGITRALRRRFYPHYERRSAAGVRWARGGASTEVLGSRIEAQIEATLRGRLPAASCRHAWARAVCAWVAEQGLEFAGAQVPIHDPRSGLTTLADFVLADPHWAEFKRPPYVLLELKTGHSYDLDGAQGTFAAPLEAIPATLRNACYAQLAWMHHVLEAVHGVPTRPVLAVVNDRTLKSKRGFTFELPDALRRAAPALVSHLP